MRLGEIHIRQQLYIYVPVSVVPANWVRRKAIIVILDWSACPFVQGWFVVVVRCFVPRRAQRDLKNLSTNLVPLSLNRGVRIPYGIVQLSMQKYPMGNVVASEVGKALVSFQNQSVTTCTYYLPSIAFGSDLNMSIVKKSSGSVAGNNCTGRWCLSDSLTQLHLQQSLTALYKWLVVCCQWFVLYNTVYIRLSLRCLANGG